MERRDKDEIMKIEEVKKLTPFERLVYWIKERESIRIKKESGQPAPWTDDEILKSYRFTNVLRIQDKVSQWLLHNWYQPYFGHPNMSLAATLARQLNNIDSMGAVGFPAIWQPKKIQEILEERQTRGLKNYSAAYMITGRFGCKDREPETKAYQTVFRVCDPIAKNPPKINAISMQLTHRELLEYQGFSSFIAGQVVADLRWGVKGAWRDRLNWAPMGPGSMRGLNQLLGRDKDTKIDQPQFLREFLELFSKVREISGLPKMEAIDFQNCLCEVDKYIRALNGEGTPKQKYEASQHAQS